eukprot:SAG31_NODE_12991_length_901_cov_1.004988_2_plen_237_part_01
MHEVDQQRDHERMVAQIARTDRAVDDCCAPVLRAIGSYAVSRCNFVHACAIKLEGSQPEAFTELYIRSGYAMKNGLVLVAGGSGAVRFGDQIVLEPTMEPKGQTWAAATLYRSIFGGGSARTVDVVLSDMVATVAKPFVRELPEAFFELMAANLDGPLAQDYRGYILHEVKPTLDLIVDVVRAYYAAIDPPPLHWLLEKFPGHSELDTPSGILDVMNAYPQAWSRVLAEWDAGRLHL